MPLAAAHDVLAGELAAVVGPAHVLADPDLRAPYERDWTGRFGGAARLVVRPADTAQVAAAVAACAAAGAAVVPQGGNTGLVGGGIPRGGEVVLSLRRLDAVGEVDAAAGQVVAGAGATLAAVQERARAAGLAFGVDFAARDSASVGGLVATDAGGALAFRHGTMRRQVAALEAVLAGGTVLPRRAGLLKDNAGYELPGLLVGSEGTLGIVTEAALRLVPLLPARVAALVALPDADAAAALLAVLRAQVASLEAVEFFLDDGLQLVLDHLGAAGDPVPRAPVHVLVQAAGRTDPTDELAEALDLAGVADAAVLADDTAGRERLWRLRERHTEAINAAGIPHKLDVGVPLGALPRFLDEVPRTVARAAPGARTILFGHLGDGNVHVNVLGAAPDDPAVDDAVLELVAACGGTISAEHGVGVAKARHLGLVRGPADLAAMRAVKAALDPAGILNPGAVLAG